MATLCNPVIVFVEENDFINWTNCRNSLEYHDFQFVYVHVAHAHSYHIFRCFCTSEEIVIIFVASNVSHE